MSLFSVADSIEGPLKEKLAGLPKSAFLWVAAAYGGLIPLAFRFTSGRVGLAAALIPTFLGLVLTMPLVLVVFRANGVKYWRYFAFVVAFILFELMAYWPRLWPWLSIALPIVVALFVGAVCLRPAAIAGDKHEDATANVPLRTDIFGRKLATRVCALLVTSVLLAIVWARGNAGTFGHVVEQIDLVKALDKREQAANEVHRADQVLFATASPESSTVNGLLRNRIRVFAGDRALHARIHGGGATAAEAGRDSLSVSYPHGTHIDPRVTPLSRIIDSLVAVHRDSVAQAMKRDPSSVVKVKWPPALAHYVATQNQLEQEYDTRIDSVLLIDRRILHGRTQALESRNEFVQGGLQTILERARVAGLLGYVAAFAVFASLLIMLALTNPTRGVPHDGASLESPKSAYQQDNGKYWVLGCALAVTFALPLMKEIKREDIDVTDYTLPFTSASFYLPAALDASVHGDRHREPVIYADPIDSDPAPSPNDDTKWLQPPGGTLVVVRPDPRILDELKKVNEAQQELHRLLLKKDGL